MTATKLILSISNTLRNALPEGVKLYSAADTENVVLPAVIVSASLRADPAIRGNAHAEVEFKIVLCFEEYAADEAVRLTDAIHAAIESLNADALNEPGECHVYFWRWESTSPFETEGADLTVSFTYATKFAT